MSKLLPPGFTSIAVANIVVEVGRATSVDVSLDSATALAGQAPTHMRGINTTWQDFSVNLNQTSFNDLPNNGRRGPTLLGARDCSVRNGEFRGISSVLNKHTIDGGDNDQAFLANERGGTPIGYGIALASATTSRHSHVTVCG